MSIKLEAKNIRLSFGDKEVLKGLDLQVPEQQIVALIGPSGCGKSTFLRCMNRLHELVPNSRLSGEILLDGQDIYAPEIDSVDIRRKVGMVFQKPNPFPKSIFENIAFGLRVNGKNSKKQMAKIVEQVLKSSFLWEEVKDQLDQSALDLSGGQQQRLCIARAIAVDPEVLLLDEPCSALDPISTGKIEELMLELKSSYTQIIVTHNMQQARRVADYTAFMYLGRLIEFGETEQVFRAPQEELTRNYISGHFG